MGMTLGQQAARLQEAIVTLTLDEAMRRINVGYRRNCEAHAWRHLIKRFTLQTEASYNTGTVAVSGTTVTGTDTVFVSSWVTAPSMRRIVVQGRGEPYDVSAIAGATSATIADTWIGSSDSGLTYRMFRDTFPLPSDCGFTKVLALYDPEQRARLDFFNQSRFIETRAGDPGLTGIPECFTLVQQTSETPPRPQIQLYPAPSTVRAYHGWYFRRPDVPLLAGSYFDWPDEFDDMHWLRAAIDHFETPRTYSARLADLYKLKYADLFRKMKTEMDGSNAIESQIRAIGSDRSQLFNFAGYSGVSPMTSW